MEEDGKYSPSLLHVLTAGKFYMEEELKGTTAAGGEVPINEYRVFIRNSEDKSRCYLISYEPDGQTRIWEGACTGDIWHKMPDSILFENKDKLGEVNVKRNHQRVREYLTFADFWNDIRRD